LNACRPCRPKARLILAGPCPAIDSPDPGPAGFSGSIIIAEFASLEASQGLGRCRPLCCGRRLRKSHRQAVQEGAAGVSAETVEPVAPAPAALQPLVALAIDDESHRHAGHAGRARGGHYELTIVAEAFAGKIPLPATA
jgi:hypothetical protein